MRTTVRRALGLALAVGLAVGTLGGAAPASAATNPAHSLAAARTHTPLTTWTWVGDSLRSSTQQNWYRLVLARDGYLSVTLGKLPRDYNLAVYDAAGVRLGSSDHAGTRFETVDVRRATAGEYFVRVASTSGSSAAEYTLNARHVTAALGALTVSRGTNFEIVGEMVNTTDQWVWTGTADITCWSSTGTKLKVMPGRFLLGWFFIAPHSKMPYSLPAWMDVPKGTTRITLAFPDVVKPVWSPVRLTTTVVSRRYDSVHDETQWTVDVTNHSARRAKMVDVLIRGYDRRGVLVGLGQPIKVYDIPPGGTVRVRALYQGLRTVTPGATLLLRAVESTDGA